MCHIMRLGIIGFGSRISGMVNGVMRPMAPELRVVGIIDPNEKAARQRLDECDRSQVVFYKQFPEMIARAKPDALAIGTLCPWHAPYAIQAAKLDLPLFLEKPVAVSMRQALALEKAFMNSRCEVVVSFPLRVSPLCRFAHQLIHGEKAVGQPEHILAVNYVPYGTCYWDMPSYHYKITHGQFLQKATHDFDYISYLMGSNIVRIGSMASYGRVFGGCKRAGLMCSKCREQDSCPESPQNRQRNQSGGIVQDHPCLFSVDCGRPDEGMNEDSSSALLEFASGAHGVYTQVFYTRRDAGSRGATVSGYHGTISFDWRVRQIKRVRHHAPFTDTTKVEVVQGHSGGDSELARNFLEVIRGSSKSLTPIWAGIRSVYACLAAKESAETGRFVGVRQVGG